MKLEIHAIRRVAINGEGIKRWARAGGRGNVRGGMRRAGIYAMRRSALRCAKTRAKNFIFPGEDGG